MKFCFNDVWKLGDLCKQNEYLVRHVTLKNKTSKYKARGQHATKSPFQNIFVVGDKLIHVCKNSFLHTIDIGDKMVQTTMNKLEENGHLQPVDLRNTCSDDCLHSALRDDFVVLRTNIKLANKAFCVAGPSAWNSLPSHIRTTDSNNRFCKQLKTYLFSLWYCYWRIDW